MKGYSRKRNIKYKLISRAECAYTIIHRYIQTQHVFYHTSYLNNQIEKITDTEQQPYRIV